MTTPPPLPLIQGSSPIADEPKDPSTPNPTSTYMVEGDITPATPDLKMRDDEIDSKKSTGGVGIVHQWEIDWV